MGYSVVDDMIREGKDEPEPLEEAFLAITAGPQPHGVDGWMGLGVCLGR